MPRKRWTALVVAAAVVALAATAAFAYPDRLLLRRVKHATAKYHNVETAKGAGYGLLLDAKGIACIDMPGQGAMGIHYVNGGLVGDGALNAQQPEALLYEDNDGALQLLGVEYIVLADAWNAKNGTPPTLGGQVFHYTGSPNRYGLPPFYALHVWAWRTNPNGMFADFNPKVSCEDFHQAPASTSSAPGARH